MRNAICFHFTLFDSGLANVVTASVVQRSSFLTDESSVLSDGGFFDEATVGTLEKFAAVENHHVAKHGFDCDHFTPEQRPHCIRFNYSLCETTPVHALRGTDLYRKDGQSGPFLFKLWPIALKDVMTPLDVAGEETAPVKSFPALALQRRSKPRKFRERPKTIHSIDQAVLEEAQALADGHKEKASDGPLGGSLSKSQPSVLVSVDTSGAGFERMASFRQSQRGLQNIGGTLDRKKRRRTVSGVPSNIMQEIEQFEQERRIDRGSHRKYSLDDLDPIDLDARDKIMQQYLLDIDAAREEREEIAYAEQREGRLLKFLPCRRSRSLPRCVQMMATPLEEGNSSTRRSKRFSKSPLASLGLSRLSLYTKRGQSNRNSRCMDEDGDEIRLEPRQTSSVLAESRRYSSNVSLGSSGSGQGRTARSLVRRGSRSGSLKRHSLLGEKLRSLVNNTLLRPRPKSLDLDALEIEESSSPSRIAASSPSVAVTNTRTGSERGRRRRGKKDLSAERSSSLSRVTSSATAIENTPTTESLPPASSSTSRAVSRDSQIGPGSYYYFDSSHTLPRAQARKYDFPWDSLPKDWTTSVKLREISKRRKEDRQSSSGNWSQSNFSSNRQSLESEAAKFSSGVAGAHSGSSSRLSQYSQGKDSGRGSPRSLHRSRHDLDPGYMGDAASTESVVSSTSTAADGSSTVAEGSSCSGEDWLRALAERAASRGDVTSTSAEALAQLSRVTRQNIQSLDLLVPGRKHNLQCNRSPQEMDNESVYSLDQEGFYTSFHTDSGLKKSTADDLDAEGFEEEKQDSLANYDFDNDLILEPRGMREFKRLQSNSSTSTLGSIILKPQLDQEIGLSSTSVSSPDLVSLSRVKPGFKQDCIPSEYVMDNNTEDVVENEDNGTLKARKSKNRPPPPPPPRSSSINSTQLAPNCKDKGDMRKRNSDSSIESASCDIPPSTLPAASLSPDEGSDHETIYARLKLKTSISVHTFPSWCTGLVSDDEDQASLKMNPLSASHERLHAEASEVQEMFNTGNVGSLLHGSAKTPVVLDEMDFPAHSWPRGKRPGSQAPFLQTGILKTPEKEKVNKGGNFSSKTLNFDPVVNLFDARTPHGVQMPLACLSSSDESGSSPPSGGRPIAHTKTNSKAIFSPLTTSSSMSQRPAYGKGYAGEKADMNHQGKEMQSISSSKHDVSKTNNNINLSSPSLFNSTGSMTSINSIDATKSGNLSNLTGSCSTIALSDIDSSSLTHVSLDEVDGNSTTSPASSTLSLCWDTDGTPNPTPAATPARSRTCHNGDATSSVDDQGTLCKHDESVSSSAFSSGQNTTTDMQNLHTTQTSQPNLTHSHSRVPSIADSCSSSASQTPTLTPSRIPPMEPLDTVYIPKKNDSNNNKTSIFQFPDAATTLSSNFFQHPHPQLMSHRDQTSITLSSSSIGSSSQSRNNRRRSSPVTSNSGRGPHAHENMQSQHGQSSRRRSGSNDLLSPADSGFGSPSAHTQPKMAVQPFQHIPPSTSTPSSIMAQSYKGNSSIDQRQPNSASMPFIKPQLLREARLDSSKFAGKSENSLQAPLNASNAKDVRHGSRHSSQESLSSQHSYNSANHVVPKLCKTDLSQPSMRSGTSSESLHSNSSAGRSDSYRVALLAEADQISLIQDRNPGFPPNARTLRSSSLIEKVPTNNKSSIDRSRSSSLTSNEAPTSSTLSSSSSHRPHLSKSMSAPATSLHNMNKTNNFHINNMKKGSGTEGDPVSRADSYRCAMQSSQSAFLYGDVVGRNSSYRLATHDEDDDGIVVNLASGNSRMDACNMWTGKTGNSRDLRRMGITDVDQLKSIPSASSGSGARSSADTQHARKKFGVRPDGAGTSHHMGRPGSNSVPGVTLRDKSSKQQKLQSSSYIRFDPIFESGEDLRGSKESLRPPSIISVRTAMAGSKETLVSDAGSSRGRGEGQRVSRSPARKRSGSQGRRSSGVEDGSRNGGLSIFGSIKTTIKSIGSGKGE
ncbi:hypothetical protein ElyMa_004688300 [Elysia marginata]|uniref:Serine-rich adhesin for platelets n=1 Tax=Elysia marginata TaxID=1093978 RepID=A0AAV4I733_9GAST|nr:hypothetical protein ElyMa_004688300 [Elysia marginata]